jgi:hypothetical protein
LNQEVFPFTIGDQYRPCALNVKCYIKPGDECPICYDKITTKKTAFMTDCGHHFHKKCLFKYVETKWFSKEYLSESNCPMCRCNLGHPEFIQRYRASYFNAFPNKNDNELDKLEDFWISKEYKLPLFCCNGYNHYLGMKNECEYCENYRKTGEIMYFVLQNKLPID